MFDPFLLKKKKKAVMLVRLQTIQLGSLASGHPLVSSQPGLGVKSWSNVLSHLVGK